MSTTPLKRDIDRSRAFGLLLGLAEGIAFRLGKEEKQRIDEILEEARATWGKADERPGCAEMPPQSNSKARMIVSTTNLLHVIGHHRESKDMHFAWTYHSSKLEGEARGRAHVMVEEMIIGETLAPWTPFSAPPHKWRALAPILRALPEQPITLVWNGDDFILHDVCVGSADN